ncbi:MAG: T9SS type A sorting domain-containing protein [Bacteroidia bacterium]
MDTIYQIMRYSYDPNVKHSYPEGIVTQPVGKVKYYIEFQNEGNDDAWRVTVVDTLDLNIPVYEFRMLGSSHSYTVSQKGNVVTWVFNNIFLKPKSLDEAGSKGFIEFEAKLHRSLRVGDSIRNRASIYFDYNSPIETNYAVIKRELEKNIPIITIGGEGLLIYPNPNSGRFKVQNLDKDSHSYWIYNNVGARVSSFRLQGLEASTINLESLSSGIYLIVSDKNQTYKLLKN